MESDERFNLIARATKDIIWDWDINADAVWWSEGLTTVFGYSRGEVPPTGKWWEEQLHPDDRERMLAELRGCAAAGIEVWSGEYRFRKADGDYADILDRVAIKYDERGAAVRMLGAMTDVTERKRATEALRISEKRFRSLIEHTTDLISVLAQDGTALYESPSCLAMLGYTPEELIGRWVFELIHPDDRLLAAEVLSEALGREELTEPVTYRFRHADGRWLVLESVARWLDDPSFSGRAAVVSTRDVTDRKLTEERLRKSEEELRALFSNLPDAVFTLDREGRCVKVAPTATNALLVPAERLTGKRLHDVFPVDEAEHFLNIVHSILETNRRQDFEFDLEADGKRRWFQATGSPLTDGTVLWVIREVTEHKKVEESLYQAQKMEAVGQLAGGIAHDFNNLLTAIIGYTDLSLSRLRPGHALHNNLKEIKTAADRAATLTRQLLAFSRRQMLRPEPLFLDDLLTKMSEMLRRLIHERVKLTFAVKPPLPYVEVDRTQLELVILNLAVNARDAMPDGGRLMLSAYAEDVAGSDPSRPHILPGTYAVLEVKDTGHGMDAETRRHIFEPFFTTKGVGAGTGLGLATAYGFVKQSGGFIYVESEVGAGTKFSIYLPAVNAAPAAAVEEFVQEELLAGTETILLVEDEEVVRTPVRIILTGLGYHVLEASQAKEAIDCCEEYDGRIDLLLTDVVMPHVGGRELAATLTALRPGIKVLFMSGYTPDEPLREGAMDGSCSFLQKPFTNNQLALKVREALGKA